MKQYTMHLDSYKYPFIKIEWLPCGKKEHCEADEVSGSYFSFKYKSILVVELEQRVLPDKMAVVLGSYSDLLKSSANL